MVSNSNKIKADFLGMPYGTACGRLKKQIMLHLLQKLGEDICYRCGEKIETVGELSVEHKEAWLHESVESFWDLDNIAFSHLKCNSAHKRYIHPKGEAPDGTAWCCGCQDFIKVSRFGLNPRKKKGYKRIYRGRCNECRKRVGWQK